MRNLVDAEIRLAWIVVLGSVGFSLFRSNGE